MPSLRRVQIGAVERCPTRHAAHREHLQLDSLLPDPVRCVAARLRKPCGPLPGPHPRTQPPPASSSAVVPFSSAASAVRCRSLRVPSVGARPASSKLLDYRSYAELRNFRLISSNNSTLASSPTSSPAFALSPGIRVSSSFVVWVSQKQTAKPCHSSEYRNHQTIEVTRGDSWKEFPEWLQQRVAVGRQISRKEIVTNIGGVEAFCCGIVMPIGVDGQRGLVAAACGRSDFPNQVDEQLISVAANSAATAVRNAHLINKLRSAQEAPSAE